MALRSQMSAALSLTAPGTGRRTRPLRQTRLPESIGPSPSWRRRDSARLPSPRPSQSDRRRLPYPAPPGRRARFRPLEFVLSTLTGHEPPWLAIEHSSVSVGWRGLLVMLAD